MRGRIKLESIGGCNCRFGEFDQLTTFWALPCRKARTFSTAITAHRWKTRAIPSRQRDESANSHISLHRGAGGITQDRRTANPARLCFTQGISWKGGGAGKAGGLPPAPGPATDKGRD